MLQYSTLRMLSLGRLTFAATSQKPLLLTGWFGAPGPLIYVFAAGASRASNLSGQDVLERVLATALVSALSLVICALSETWRHVPTPDRPLPAEPERPLRSRLAAASRSTIGAGISVLLSHAFGADHPARAAMGALAIMQGAHLHNSMNRALQRMAGTVVGACGLGSCCYRILQSGR